MFIAQWLIEPNNKIDIQCEITQSITFSITLAHLYTVGQNTQRAYLPPLSINQMHKQVDEFAFPKACNAVCNYNECQRLRC